MLNNSQDHIADFFKSFQIIHYWSLTVLDFKITLQAI